MADEMMKHNRKTEKCGDCVTLRPCADLTDETDGMEITFELPGCRPEEICLEIQERLLQLCARSSLMRHGRNVAYKRAFYLSDAVDVEKITAHAADGLLTVFLPKSEAAKPHKITVR